MVNENHRTSCAEMHQVFQRNLLKLQLEAARGYVKSIQTSLNPISTSQTEPLKLSARVGTESCIGLQLVELVYYRYKVLDLYSR